MRVKVKPEMLRWARERAGVELSQLESRFAKIEEWEEGQTLPTLNQLNKFAKAVYVPMGFLFLEKPPNEEMPIPDFRTFDGQQVKRASPNLLEVIYDCQDRLSWFRKYAQMTKQDEIVFIGTRTASNSPVAVADEIRRVLGFDLDARRTCGTWNDALRMLIQNAEQSGILVMVSGVVKSNTRRKLSIEEFRGFALVDNFAPLVFINGTDTKSGQMFTLAHEIAHLWLGKTALSNVSAAQFNEYNPDEVWCNKVAAELLVPLSALKKELTEENLEVILQRLSRVFKVSTLVIMRRLLDANWMSQDEFDVAWPEEVLRLRNLMQAGSGGNFYNTTPARVSKRFAKAVVSNTLEGQTLYRDAFRMLGLKKSSTFNELGRTLGVIL